MISEDEVKKIAILSQLALPEGEKLTEIQDSLSDILDLVRQLEAIDTANVTPLAHPIEMVQRLREDVVTEENERVLLQESAPLTADGFYLVPKIID